MSAMLVGLALLAATEAAPPAPVVWTALRREDARQLLVEAGGLIRTVEETSEKGWMITAEIPDGLIVNWVGMECVGDADDRACTEHQIIIDLPMASREAAEAFAGERNILYPADSADDGYYRMWRMDFTYGGVTREHLKNTLGVTIDLGWEALAAIKAEGAGKPAP